MDEYTANAVERLLNASVREKDYLFGPPNMPKELYREYNQTYPYRYYSALRPLDFWFRMDGKHQATDRFLWTMEPIMPEFAQHHDFIPVNASTRGQLGIDYCREQFGEVDSFAFYKDLDSFHWIAKTITPATNPEYAGQWQITYYGEYGPEGHHFLPTLRAAFGEVLTEGYRPIRSSDFDGIAAEFKSLPVVTR